MKNLIAIALVAAAGSAAQADIFSDNFDTENGGSGQLNYGGLANWTVSSGTIDLIGNGLFDFLPGNGLYIDLDGSTGDAGQLMSVNIFLTPGSYTLFYDLAGSHRGTDETVDVTFGGEPTVTHTNIPSAQGFTTYSINMNVAVAGNVTITFQNMGGDNVGALLDNVRVVPTPGAVALIGLGGLAAARRRR
jgi:MYXO-CTERM domain-containing protein